MDEPPSVIGDQFYLRAFWRLGTMRQLGMSQGPIPWDKTEDYALRCGFDEEMCDAFWRIISVMDDAYLNWVGEESEKRRKYG